METNRIPNLHPLQSQLFAGLGLLLIHEKEALKELMQKNGIEVPANATKQEWIDLVWRAIETRGATFHHDLALLFYEKKDSFLPKQTASALEGAKVNFGVDPVSAIAGAVGSIASIIGNSQQKKQMQQAARSQTLASVLAYKSRNQSSPVRKESSLWTILKVLLVVGVLGVCTWFILPGPKKTAFMAARSTQISSR